MTGTTAIDGRTLDGELVAPVGVNLDGALFFALGVFPCSASPSEWSVPPSAPAATRRDP